MQYNNNNNNNAIIIIIIIIEQWFLYSKKQYISESRLVGRLVGQSVRSNSIANAVQGRDNIF